MTIDPHDIRSAWDFPGPWTIRAPEHGTNNRSFFVETTDGSYLLRIYQNAGDLVQIRYEHGLLLRLQEGGLSFAVPRPLATSAGETYVVRDGIVAALFPVIEGRRPVEGSVVQAAACGEALGELDHALAGIELEPPPGMPHFGDLVEDGPLVEVGLRLLDHAPDGDSDKLVGRLRDRFTEIMASIPHLVGRLPEQVIHGDFYRSNVLMREDRVSGVLDFEFAGPGPRAMELAAAVRGFSYGEWGSERFWHVVEALAGGYRRRVTLSGAEIQALPALLMLREATSWVHRVGQHRRGLRTRDDLRERAASFLRLDELLRAHGEELVRRVARRGLRNIASE
jgi:Ser/Thr protein kinase RdoA (MazF antagonist)